jgi:predicted RNase H-like nuclease (RuvC/YqgF family)
MPQIRKFEQDAIVDGICTQIVANSGHMISKLEETPEYKNLVSLKEQMGDFGKKIRELENAQSELREQFNEARTNFNESISHTALYVDSDSYYRSKENSSVEIKVNLSSYSNAREQISNKLAVKLLPSDSLENIQAIMSSIVDEFLEV